VISGDITVERAKELAEKLLADWKPADNLAKADYSLPPRISKRQLILVDNPDGKQSTIRMAVRAYDLHNDDKFPGAIATRILSDGIESRLNKYVRAEKGYTYGCYGTFQPGRHAGTFGVTVDTNPDTTQPCIEAVFKVLNDMRAANVPEAELYSAKFRVSGNLLMTMETIRDQATRRIDGILNGYPIDYYDKYAQRISQATPDQVRANMTKYVQENHMVVVVVGPAEAIKPQLEKLGKVEVIPVAAK